MDKTDTVREQILDAAWDRLSHYGLNKTTMVEIAEDCSMSAANLYRYFKNKNDIASACCGRAMDQTADELSELVRDSRLSATEKLTQYAVRMVERNVEHSAGKNKIGELVANMTENNSDLIHEKIGVHDRLIAEILAQGNASGEFMVDDIVKTAGLIYTSLVAFDVPLFANLYPLETYRKFASNLIALLITGIGVR